MKVITIVNAKAGYGCTSIALMMAAAANESLKLKTAVVEIARGAFDSPVYCGLKQPAPEAGAVTEVDRGKNPEVRLFNDNGDKLELLLEAADKAVDLLIIDTQEINEKYLEAADLILVPAVLEHAATKQAAKTLQDIRALKYPLSAIKLIVNKNEVDGMTAADIAEIFPGITVAGFLPFSPALKKAFNEGKADAFKQSKDKFYSALKAVSDALVNGLKPKNLQDRFLKKVSFVDETSHDIFQEKDPEHKKELDEALLKVIELKKKIYYTLFAEIDIRKMENEAVGAEDKKIRMKQEIRNKIASILDRFAPEMNSREEREKITDDLFNEVVGYGPIEEFLKDPSVTEIMVNRFDTIYVERKGKLYLTDRMFTDKETVRRVIERIVMPLGRRIDESMPHVDARLPDGSRVNAIIPPLALDGSVLTIRKFPDKQLSVQDIINYGSITQDAADYLKSAVEGKKNIIISGGTGSGKTTLLNVISSFIPEGERIITIEDSAELRLEQNHVVRLETRAANLEGKGEVSIRDLVRNSLRMRPDRIVVGECRGGEALDMLQAMNTGHEGSMTTLHSNSPRDALSRLEVMVLSAGIDLPMRAIREQIRGAVNIIIQQSRMADGTRKITQISEVTGMEGDTLLMQNAFELSQPGEGGKVSLIRGVAPRK